MTGQTPIRRALVSVSDKTGLAELGAAFAAHQVAVVSTGSTAALLRDAGAQVTEVADLTGFPECLDGRVKTLHPGVHAAVLADRRLQSHRDQLAELGIEPFDLVVSSLYPFAQTVASGAGVEDCLEQIDIGGPAMVRAAAKNHPSVAVVTSVDQYPQLLEALATGGFTLAQRRRLAVAALRHTAAYDVAVASWMGSALVEPDELPDWYGATYTKSSDLRYGENAHQPAALYAGSGSGLATAEQLHGKEMSFNNYTDGEAAYRAVYDFSEPAVVIIKHANPCGIAVGADIAEAHRKAHACDPVSAFGGVVATNRPVSLAMAEQVSEVFTEVVVAPGYEAGAAELLARKKSIRLLVAPAYPGAVLEQRQVSGGLLLQRPDRLDDAGDDPASWRLQAGEPVSPQALADLAFAWRACRAVKSNAILLAHDLASVGVGMGQVNRVDSCRLAVQRAGDRAAGSVAASDAFFPFADGPQILIQSGVSAVVEPGGSVRDAETVAACQEAGVALYFTGTRHFFH